MSAVATCHATVQLYQRKIFGSCRTVGSVAFISDGCSCTATLHLTTSPASTAWCSALGALPMQQAPLNDKR